MSEYGTSEIRIFQIIVTDCCKDNVVFKEHINLVSRIAVEFKNNFTVNLIFPQKWWETFFPVRMFGGIIVYIRIATDSNLIYDVLCSFEYSSSYMTAIKNSKYSTITWQLSFQTMRCNLRFKDTPNYISSRSKIVKRLRRRQYDPMIIERTIGLVLGPWSGLYRPFLKHCILTKKAVETIWRALSKPPQRRQGPDLRPLWLLVGTPSAIRPELAFSRAEHSLPYSDVTIYIFAISNLSSMF